LGLALSEDVYPIKDQNWYLSLGFRMNTTETKVFTINRDFVWDYHWQALTLPFHIGYSIVPPDNKGFPIDIYGGVSYGKILISKALNPGNDFEFGKGNLTTLDAGINIHPIRHLPNVGLGFVFIYNFQAQPCKRR